MSRPIQVVGICGSLRRDSYNRALLEAATTAIDQPITWSMAEIGDLPLYNGDVEVRGFPEPVARLRTQVGDADAVLFASPEYNWSITGALKNAIDWMSRNPMSPLDYKPAAIIGGGGRSGGARSQAHLREVLAHNRVEVLEEHEVVVSRVWEVFDADLTLTDKRVAADLALLMNGFVAHIQRCIERRPRVVLLGDNPEEMARPYRTLVADYRVFPALSNAAAAALTQDRQARAVVTVGDAVAASPGLGAVPVVAGDDLAALPALLESSLSAPQ